MKKFSKFIIVGGQIGVSSESSSDFILSDISHEIDENIYNSIVIIIPYPQIDNNITTLLSVDLNVNTQKKQLQIINNEKDNRICTFYTIDNLKYTTCNILTLMNILKDFLSFSNGVSQSDSNSQLTNSNYSNHINKRKLKEICNKLNIHYNKNINKTLDLIYKKINEN